MMLVGISGPSAAGKSLLCQSLKDALPKCEVLQQDWYYKDPHELDPAANFCDPQWLHWEQFLADVRRLADGGIVEVEAIDTSFRRVGKVLVVHPRPITIVEGMTIFRSEEILSMLDLALYLDPGVPALSRRKWHRDRTERGKTDAEIRHQLEWVEREYQADLQSLPPNARRIRSDQAQEAVTGDALECILSKFRQVSARTAT